MITDDQCTRAAETWLEDEALLGTAELVRCPCGGRVSVTTAAAHAATCTPLREYVAALEARYDLRLYDRTTR